MADKKVTELPPIDTIAMDDLLLVIDGPSGTPVSKKATVNQLGDALAPSQVIALTGVQNNLALIPGCSMLILDNPSLLTISGMSAGYDGQSLTIFSSGTGHVDLLFLDGGSSPGNRLLNYSITTRSLYGGVGRAVYRYNAAALGTGAWQLVAHDQGTALPYTPTWTATTTNPAVGNGTITGGYLLRGLLCDIYIQVTLGPTTTLGSGPWRFSLPFPISPTPGVTLPVASGFITGGGQASYYPMIGLVSTFVSLVTDYNNTGVSAANPVGMIATGGVGPDFARIVIIGYPIG